MKIYLAFDGGLAVLQERDGAWQPTLALPGEACQCLAVDPHDERRVYCGTFTSGLWRSDDAGATWTPVPRELPHTHVMAVAVSPLETVGGHGVLWAGTEPSALFRSEDGGAGWTSLPALQELPSAPTWSFPPRPWTHHVRWIEPDATESARIFAGIELGGVMRSVDRGATWEDRKPNSQYDCHTLRTHPAAPGVLYEAAGGGFAESRDGGRTWQRHDDGLHDRYLWGLAVDPADPDVLVVSASPGPRSAHNDAYAEARLHRRVGDGPWQPLEQGLPPAKGTRAFVPATHPSAPHTFYAATRRDLYRSTDGGVTWTQLPIAWPADVTFTTVNALALADMA